MSLCPVPRTQSWLVLSQDRCLTPMGSGDPALSHTSQLPPFASNIRALELRWGRGGRGGESWGEGGRTHWSPVLGKSSQTWNSGTRSLPGLRGLPGVAWLILKSQLSVAQTTVAPHRRPPSRENSVVSAGSEPDLHPSLSTWEAAPQSLTAELNKHLSCVCAAFAWKS